MLEGLSGQNTDKEGKTQEGRQRSGVFINDERRHGMDQRAMIHRVDPFPIVERWALQLLLVVEPGGPNVLVGELCSAHKVVA